MSSPSNSGIVKPVRGDLRSRPPGEAVRLELEKILSSHAFRGAESQKKFLRYCVEKTIDGQGEQIKEYSIALEVFGRAESFDTRLNSTVRTQASKLRTRLAKYYEEEGRGDPVRIEFPKGHYEPIFVLVAPLAPQDSSEAPLLAAPPSPAAPAAPIPTAFRPIRIKNLWALAIPVLLIASGAALWFKRDAAPASKPPSIVVLPFKNLSAGPDDELFSEGLTDDIIDALTRVQGLRVVARNSAFQYKGKALDIRRIGKELNAATVLEGSVRKDGNLLRVVIQLEDATNGYHLWSARYDRDQHDLPALREEISASVIQVLRIEP